MHEIESTHLVKHALTFEVLGVQDTLRALII